MPAWDFLSRLFWVEIGLFLLPVLILSNPAHRRNARMLFLAALAMLLAGSLYRLDAFLIAFDPNTNPGDNWTYFPSVPEMMVTVGVIATEVLAYIVFARFFPVMHKIEQFKPVTRPVAAE